MLWVPGVLPWAQGQPVPPRSRGALTAPRWRVGFFKESVTFCLNLQVDFTNTSAEAAANFVIYRSQNTYKRDLYHYIMVQREKMQPWEGSWLNGKQTSQPSAPTAPPPPPLHALWRCPLAVLHLQQQQIFQLLFHLYSEHGHKETQHHQKVSACFFPPRRQYKPPFTNFWFHWLCRAPSKSLTQHRVVFCTAAGKSCKLYHCGCCLLQKRFLRPSSPWALCRGRRVINAANDWPENTQDGTVG